MARAAWRRTVSPAPQRPDRGVTLERGLHAIALLRSAPITTRDLAATLDVSRDTVERILAAIRRAGLPLSSEARGRERRHSLPAETLGRALP